LVSFKQQNFKKLDLQTYKRYGRLIARELGKKRSNNESKISDDVLGEVADFFLFYKH